ncbi:MAG: hypothetical protein J7K59_04045 [Candidatus Korarchaeota archaeon]|nr:hypothetical protein [Candidatus Korarchaeota archaeon]
MLDLIIGVVTLILGLILYYLVIHENGPRKTKKRLTKKVKETEFWMNE